MLRTENQGAGIALLCDEQGKIVRVIRDEFGLAVEAVGSSLTRLVDRDSFQKALQFLHELRTEGAAFDWELHLSTDNQMLTLHFGGGMAGEQLLIIGATTRSSVFQLYEELMRISNEQVNTMRTTTKEQVNLTRSQAERDDALYNEFSQLNNELVTLQRKLTKKNQEQQRLNEELQRLNELKNKFLGIAAHDLRGPLANIQLAADFLLNQFDTLPRASMEEMLQSIDRQAQYMSTLISDLLDVTQIEAGKLDLNPEPVDLVDFLAEAVKHFAKIAAPKETRVLLEANPVGTVEADPVRLRQVVDNLISNAIKYSPPGSTVTVSAEKIESGWRVNVEDEGPGITEEDRQRLFQEFARLSAKPTGGEKSTGLGLAISRRVVETHGGKIGVDSEPGHGSTFWFTLPTP